MREQAEQQVGAKGTGGAQKPGSAGGVTITLIVVLLVVGALGAVSLWALDSAPGVAPTSSQDQLAGRVCTAYQTRNYDLLIANIDPTPVPPTQPLPFSDAAKKSLTSTLQAQDSQQGAVTQCSFQQLPGGAADHVQYGFAMTRAKGSKFTPVMNFVRQKDGTWKIARNSQFLPLG
ncbi:MAG TPA: hypothetical protein VJQ45_08115 [Ktedonobacterales bacterium]|nr:hypothetical protein [Ktedonobacterales bacterium]